MNLSELIYAVDLLGTLVFAISGTLAAGDKKLDLFGAFVLAFITAVGGGTIRDVLIGKTPVGWMTDLNYLAMIAAGVLSSFFLKVYILKLRRTFFLFDTIGIGLFTILGVQKALGAGLSPVIAIAMGTVSAVFGGVLRDVLSNDIPLIFRKEIYATACAMGGLIFVVLSHYVPENIPICMGVTIVFIIAVRFLSVTKKWSLPIIK